MLGVAKNKVILLEHRKEWAEEFEIVKKKMECLYDEEIVDIQHVGSTAIEGIAAKPMLDIAILFKSVTEAIIEKMIEAGYVYFGEVAEGKYLMILRGENESSLQHVHCYGQDRPSLFYEQIRFRDFLRAHAEYAKEYELLKLELSQRYANDRNKYTVGKQAFFDKIKKLATPNE